ncbi:MAG: helix-turn-helix transcriptional regulator [Deltaproteobacteria bacterium]|nr:helix-turn-helix transcriptional regulator [Deltaproteobacteria bacterium]
MLVINPKEMYKTALQYYMEKQGWGGEYTTALKANVSQPTLNRIKLGKRSGKHETLAKIASALDTTYEDMLALGRYLMSGEKREKQIEVFRLLQIAKAILESGEEDMVEMLKQNILNTYNIIKDRTKSQYVEIEEK